MALDADSLAADALRKAGGAGGAARVASPGQSLIRMDWEGASDLEAALYALGSDPTIRNVLKRSVVEALEPVAKAARAKAPRSPGAVRTKKGSVDSGTYAETIDVGLTLSRHQKGTSTVDPPGPTTAAAFAGPKANGPGVLLEFGTAQRHWRNGKSTGAAPAQPHMRPAWEANKDRVLTTLGEMLWVQIAAAAQRIARKQSRLINGNLK